MPQPRESSPPSVSASGGLPKAMLPSLHERKEGNDFMLLETTKGFQIINDWLASKHLRPFQFQKQTWQHIINGQSGLVNAPTGCGKTFSVFLGAIIDFINHHPDHYKTKKKSGLQLIWITPLRALAKDIGRAMEEVISELEMNWKIAIRNGDTPISEREKQKRQMPEVLIITPESLHLLLAQKGYPEFFRSLKIIAVDEWHELIGSKRGVQVELALSRLVALSRESGVDSRESIVDSKQTPDGSKQQAAEANSRVSGIDYRLSIWGISATIGNLEEAKEVLLSPIKNEGSIVKAGLKKEIYKELNDDPVSRAGDEMASPDGGSRMGAIEVESVFPDEIEKFPWAGHLGIKLVDKVIPIINNSRTTLIFINTRGMSEIWYQTLLNHAPELSGAIALHHGSIEHELRIWVEEALHAGKLKAVVCTSSLDLGVDFRPVETVIQVGSPKGVARFLQRAGRSGHSPDATSKIYFLPTHSLELMEAAALKTAIKENFIENREPMLLCFDVLIQYLCTLAISEGFIPDEIFEEVSTTFCFREMGKKEWQHILVHITIGGNALQQYDEFKKVEIENGVYKIKSRRVAMRHRLHIGTIVSEPMLKVKFLSGGYVGVIEEYFISRLSPGDVFTLAGRRLEFIMIKEMTVLVRKSTAKKSLIPSWEGGRMPLSAKLGKMLRRTLDEASGEGGVDSPAAPSASLQRPKELIVDSSQPAVGSKQSAPNSSEPIHHSPFTIHQQSPELQKLQPLFELQQRLSHVPKENELLVEQIETEDGFHLFVYPFEGRLVHEAMAAILAYRVSRITPITFSFAMNDYGFELLSDKPIPVDDANVYDLFTTENLFEDIQRSVNATEMAKRKFRDIAVIGGLIFQGYPGEQKKAKHLQSSASLLFNVFSEYEPENVLLRQAYQEVFDQQMEEVRLRNMLERIQKSKIVITFPRQLTPFCFPIKVDSWREDLSSEKLEERVKRMQLQLEEG